MCFSRIAYIQQGFYSKFFSDTRTIIFNTNLLPICVNNYLNSAVVKFH